MSLTTNTNGMASPLQTFDPWGAVRSGAITSTEWNYTNQRKDADTGLLFYNGVRVAGEQKTDLWEYIPL